MHVFFCSFSSKHLNEHDFRQFSELKINISCAPPPSFACLQVFPVPVQTTSSQFVPLTGRPIPVAAWLAVWASGIISTSLASVTSATPAPAKPARDTRGEFRKLPEQQFPKLSLGKHMEIFPPPSLFFHLPWLTGSQLVVSGGFGCLRRPRLSVSFTNLHLSPGPTPQPLCSPNMCRDPAALKAFISGHKHKSERTQMTCGITRKRPEMSRN